jgi:hypothetical protein
MRFAEPADPVCCACTMKTPRLTITAIARVLFRILMSLGWWQKDWPNDDSKAAISQSAAAHRFSMARIVAI